MYEDGQGARACLGGGQLSAPDDVPQHLHALAQQEVDDFLEGVGRGGAQEGGGWVSGERGRGATFIKHGIVKGCALTSK